MARSRKINTEKHPNTLTPSTAVCHGGLDLNGDGWEDANSDCEDETNGKSHHPDLQRRRSIKTVLINLKECGIADIRLQV